MGNSAVIVPRDTGHQSALRIRQMNIPFHRHREIRGKRFRIITEHIRQTFPQVDRVTPRINAPENTILRPEHAHGSEKNAPFFRRAAKSEQSIVKIKGEKIPEPFGFRQRPDRKETHQFHLNPAPPFTTARLPAHTTGSASGMSSSTGSAEGMRSSTGSAEGIVSGMGSASGITS